MGGFKPGWNYESTGKSAKKKRSSFQTTRKFDSTDAMSAMEAPKQTTLGVEFKGEVRQKKGLVKQSHPVTCSQKPKEKASQGRSNQFPKCPLAIFLQRQESSNGYRSFIWSELVIYQLSKRRASRRISPRWAWAIGPLDSWNRASLDKQMFTTLLWSASIPGNCRQSTSLGDMTTMVIMTHDDMIIQPKTRGSNIPQLSPLTRCSF